MVIPDEVRKCVVFVGRETKHGPLCIGTGFMLGRTLSSGVSVVYCVTARHILDHIKERSGYKVHLRLNFVNAGAKWIETPLQDWIFHPQYDNVDVALCPFPLGEEHDHLVCSLSRVLDEDRLKRDSLGIGDEVFLVGLFSQHIGSERNIPIVRVGNIAAMPEEYVATKWGAMEAYLIEARSIGGLSGSPVFANMGQVRIIQGSLRVAKTPAYYLVGLIHGHWDAPDSILATSSEDNRGSGEQVNMGIAIVVPIQKVIETLNQKAILDLEREAIEKKPDQSSAGTDDRFKSSTLTTSDL